MFVVCFRYLMFSTILVALAVCLSTIILNIHYRMPSTHKMPAWVRRIFIQKLPRLLLMRVPLQVIKDSMNTRRSKFLRQSDPALKSLAGTFSKQRLRRSGEHQGHCKVDDRHGVQN